MKIKYIDGYSLGLGWLHDKLNRYMLRLMPKQNLPDPGGKAKLVDKISPSVTQTCQYDGGRDIFSANKIWSDLSSGVRRDGTSEKQPITFSTWIRSFARYPFLRVYIHKYSSIQSSPNVSDHMCDFQSRSTKHTLTHYHERLMRDLNVSEPCSELRCMSVCLCECACLCVRATRIPDSSTEEKREVVLVSFLYVQ